jgi:hypothetical protein
MFENLQVTLFYGLLLSVMLVLAWRSGDLVLQKVASWVGVSWCAANVLWYVMGPKGEPWIAPTVQAVIAIVLGHLAIRHRSWTAWAVISVYVIQAGWTVLAFSEHIQGQVVYYAMLNALFLTRISIVGGASTYAMARRVLAGDWGAHRHAPGRAHG